jgi:hypothetical protein
MIPTAWTICGLVLDVSGVLILAGGELSSLFAFASYTSRFEGWNSEVAKRPWWSRPLLRFAARWGSTHVEDMGDASPIDAVTVKLLAYAFIFFGFVLQAAGSWAARP